MGDSGSHCERRGWVLSPIDDEVVRREKRHPKGKRDKSKIINNKSNCDSIYIIKFCTLIKIINKRRKRKPSRSGKTIKTETSICIILIF